MVHEWNQNQIILFHLKLRTNKWLKVHLIKFRIESYQLCSLLEKGNLVLRSSICWESADKKEENKNGRKKSHLNSSKISDKDIVLCSGEESWIQEGDNSLKEDWNGASIEKS